MPFPDRMRCLAVRCMGTLLAVAAATGAPGARAGQNLEVIGICHFAENPSEPDNAANMLSVDDEVRGYFAERHWRSSSPVVSEVLRAPRHGRLTPDPPGVYTYRADPGYLGNDRLTIIAKLGQKTLRMEYFVRVVSWVQANDQEPDMLEQGYCPVKTRVWKIKSSRR